MRVTKQRADHVVPVRPTLVRLLGRDHAAAIYYQQLLYYSKREVIDTEGFFPKSASEMEGSTALTRRQQDRAREKLARLGWIESRPAFAGLKFRVLREGV